MSRPSRSQVQVRVGSYASGLPRLLTFHWSMCKVAHMREDTPEASRVNVGRKKKVPDPTAPADGSASTEASPERAGSVSTKEKEEEKGAKIQTENFETLSSKRPHPDYIKKGPIITREMMDQWTPEMLSSPQTSRPVRKTRNQNPNYVDAIACPG